MTSPICVLFCGEDSFLARRCGTPSDEGFIAILKAFLYRLFPRRKKLGGKVAWTIFFLFYLSIVSVMHNTGGER